jgi:hypothetical protein
MIYFRHASLVRGIGVRLSSAAGCLSIFSGLAFPASSIGQVAFTPTGAPGAISPNISSGTSNFGIETGVICPGTTLNVLGFGGNVNAWGDRHYAPYEASSAGTGNYGIAAGISIPLGGSLMEYCKKYTKERLEQQSTLGRNRRINSQFAMFRHCEYFSDRGFSFKEPEFNQSDGPLSVFKDCKRMASLFTPEQIRKRSTPKTPIPPGTPAPSSFQPEPAPSAPLNRPATPVIITQ